MKKFKDVLNEVAPAGWEGTVKAMKKNKNVDNPWALAWYMKNKGYTSHEARQAIKSGYWPQGYKTTDLAIERKKARAEKAERIGKVVDVLTVEEAPANSTADIAIRSGGLKAGNKGRHVLLTRNVLSARLWLLNGGPKKWEVLNLTKEEVDEDAPANSTADVAMRDTPLFKRKKKDVKEALFKAKVVGFDPIYVEKKSAGEVKTALRKALKNPKDIEYVEKISKTEYKKDVLKRFSGKDDEDTKSVDENEIEESRFEVAIKGFPWHVYVDANNPSQVKKDMSKMLRPGYSITTIHMAR